MADDFGSAQAADPAAGGERQIAGQAVEKTAGVEIARSGGVDDARHRRRRDAMLASVRQDHAARGTAGQCRDRDVAAHGRGGFGKVGGLVERADLGFVGEEDVDMSVDEVAKRLAMAPDAERVGEAERHLAPGGMGDRRGLAKRLLRLRRVEQIAFEIGDLAGDDHVGVDVGGPEFGAGAEIGVHRALPVGGDEDQAARRARAARRRRRIEAYADRGDVVAVDLPQEVVAHLADIGAGAAERGEAGHRVADRAARDLDRRPHHLVERLGARRVDQGHRPLDERLTREKRLFGMGDHVDNRIADADDVETGLGHVVTGSWGR